MCLAVPARIVEIDGHKARVEVAGVARQASLMMLPEAQVGDYVIVHAGFAIQVLDEAEALATLDLFAQMEEAEGGGQS